LIVKTKKEQKTLQIQCRIVPFVVLVVRIFFWLCNDGEKNQSLLGINQSQQKEKTPQVTCLIIGSTHPSQKNTRQAADR
jgi:hypothetical protein